MIDLEKAKAELQSWLAGEFEKLAIAVCDELSEAREIVEELGDNPYEKMLAYHRALKNQHRDETEATK